MENKQSKEIFWQAHRGGGAYEAPDNTLAAFKYAWGLGGIPEADIRSTGDGVIVCLHDETLARTTTAPDSIKDMHIASLTFEEIRKWDTGIKFNERFKGERVPSIEEVFAEMQGQPSKMLYIDLKDVNLEELGALIDRYKVNKQVIFAHNKQSNCFNMRNIAAGVRTMLWIGGTAEAIKEKFHIALKTGFNGLDQVQIHLNPIKEDNLLDWAYQIDEDFLRYALEKTGQYKVELEVLPFTFGKEEIRRLLDLGIYWYATDEPARFKECVNMWRQN